MFHSDLEAFHMEKERLGDLLNETARRRIILRCRHGHRRRFGVWLGNQLIIIGVRLKGGEK